MTDLARMSLADLRRVVKAWFQNDPGMQPDLNPNSVGTAQLQDSSVTTAKILDGTILAADIQDGQAVKKVYDITLDNSTTTQVNVPWPLWASKLRVYVDAVGNDTDTNNYQHIQVQINGVATSSYYWTVWSEIGTSNQVAITYGVIGQILAGGVDGTIMSPVVADFTRPVGTATKTTWLAHGSLWMPATTKFENRHFSGMLNVGIVPDTLSLTLANSALNAGSKKFLVNSRVIAYGLP